MSIGANNPPQQYPAVIRPILPLLGGGSGASGSNRFPFYVNPATPSATNLGGDDSRDGLSIPGALKTLQEAIDRCVAGVGDRIIMLGTETVTQTVNFNKSRIIVQAVDYGVAPGARGEYVALLADESFTDGPVATITAACRIEGLGFVSRDTGATFFSGAAALIGGAAAGAFGVHMYRCRFPKWALDNRIGLALAGGAAVSDVLIEECAFEGVGTDFDSGIYVQGACQNINIINNTFRDCTYGIVHGAFAGGGPECVYKSNVFQSSKVLAAGGNAATGLLADNWSPYATNATSYDDTVAALQGLGLNFSGNHYSE